MTPKPRERRGGGPAYRRVPAALSVSFGFALLVTGCVTAGSLEPQERTPARPWSELAAPAETRAGSSTAPPPARRSTARRPVPRAAPSRQTVRHRAAPTRTATPATWYTVLDQTDRRDDLGLTGGEPYGDLVRLRIDDDGGNARVTVRLAGAVPERLAEGEVVGIGVDLFRTNATESDYQLFLDGGTHGWRAFLHTPDGFAPFPGTLRIDDRRLISELPWSSLGGRTAAGVSAFADWSASGPLSEPTQDRLPDEGTRRVTFD